MAWTDVECKVCGKTYSVQMYGKMKDREWKVANWMGSCEECLGLRRQEELESAQEASKEMGLPDLAGTEKQIAWATKIRAELVANQERGYHRYTWRERDENNRLRDGYKPLSQQEIEAVDRIVANKVSAGWWIDQRDEETFYQAIVSVAESMKPEKQAEKSVKKEADIEAAVYPETPVTQLVTTISITEDTISAVYPERNDIFRQIIRFGLGYSWSGSAWKRKIGKLAGKIEDRAAELGHQLVSKGFPIRIHREDIRMAAILGQYDPEQTRWVINLEKGVGLRWGKKEDLYQEAKKLRGAKYNRKWKAVEVPAENFDEVLDFSETHGFSISDKAREKLDAAKEAREGALRIKVEPVKEPEKTTAKQPELKAPETVEVHDDLRDDD